MATYLAHIQIKPGREADFEGIVATLYRETHLHEPGCSRYEYWRGDKEGTYYGLGAFDDFLAFIDHQTSDHHEEPGPDLKDVIDTIHVEWVDPIGSASPLPPTDPQPLPDGASALAVRNRDRFAVDVRPWWRRLRQSSNSSV